MAYCTSCGGEISQGGSYCQHCGTPLAKAAANIDTNAQLRQKGGGGRKILKRAGIGCGGLIGLLVVLIIIGAIVGSSDDNENSAENLVPNPTNRIGATVESPIRTYTTAPTSSPIPTTTPTPLPIKVGLAELFDEYDQNKVRANASLRYIENGKTPVSTAGNVSQVEERYVIITSTQEGYGSQRLYCYYADTRAALHLTKGQFVSVTGRVSGTHGYSRQIHMFACDIAGMQLETKPSVSLLELGDNVVQVFCESGSFLRSGSKGTGIIMDAEEGTVLTVHHVIADENECERIEVQLEGIETRIPASPVKHCASIDGARLRISPQVLSALSLKPIYRASAPAQIDQEIYFWGYGPGELRMESGIVKDVLGKDVITDAYAVPGDSGSPVFDENGHLLGTMSRSNRSDRAVFTGDEC